MTQPVHSWYVPTADDYRTTIVNLWEGTRDLLMHLAANDQPYNARYYLVQDNERLFRDEIHRISK